MCLSLIHICLYAAISDVPESVLDLMALELNAQYYEQNLPRNVKEQLVEQTLLWYMPVSYTHLDVYKRQLLVSTVSQQTGQIPDTVIQEISAKNGQIQAEARNILEAIRNTFAEGVQAEIPITLNTVTQYRLSLIHISSGMQDLRGQ